jgi:hypothetical protein
MRPDECTTPDVPPGKTSKEQIMAAQKVISALETIRNMNQQSS